MTAIVTPTQIAAHRDVAAVFTYAVNDEVGIIGTSSDGSHVRQWCSPALLYARTCVDANVEVAVLHLGDDAQALRFTRAGDLAIVVVIIGGSAITKSIRRMMRLCLQNLARQRRAQEADATVLAQVKAAVDERAAVAP